MKGYYLITTDEWFIAPDGKDYKAVWGNVEILPDTMLGIKTNKGSANWYAKIGNENNHAIIAGCQIQYAVKCDAKPENKDNEIWSIVDGKIIKSNTPCRIYFAE